MPQQAATTASVTPVQPSFPAPGAAFMSTGTTPEVRRPRGGKPSNRHLLLAHLGLSRRHNGVGPPPGGPDCPCHGHRGTCRHRKKPASTRLSSLRAEDNGR